jgi:16S rRNA (uracil1498-N3)-methyltransferase
MNTRRFFTDHPVTGATLRISGDEYHHLRYVNRAKCGDQIEAIDGRGSLYFGEIQRMNYDEAVVRVEKEEKTEKPPVSAIIAPSLLKSRAMSIMIEKLTEIGVDEIRPVFFTRTDEKYSPSRLKKWHRIAVQSLKVNKKLWCTDIYPPVSLDELIELSAAAETRILLDITGKPASGNQWHPPVFSIIGPPGDLTAEERDQLVKNGFIPYKINNYVLKSETAAILIGAVLKLKHP